MPLTLDIKETAWRIRELVWGGFHPFGDIGWRITDEYLGNATDEDELWVADTVARECAEKQAAEDSWPPSTEYARLDHVFRQLNKERYITLHRAGNDQTEGKEEARTRWVESGGKDSGVLGYCFYHSQDVDRAVHTGNLFLSFSGVGPTPEERDANTNKLAARLVSLLNEADFSVLWNGSLDERLQIQLGQWRKRSTEGLVIN